MWYLSSFLPPAPQFPRKFVRAEEGHGHMQARREAGISTSRLTKPHPSSNPSLTLLTPVHESALYSRPPEGMSPPARPMIEIAFWGLQNEKVGEQMAALGHTFRCPLGAGSATSPEQGQGQQSPCLTMWPGHCGVGKVMTHLPESEDRKQVSAADFPPAFLGVLGVRVRQSCQSS